MEKIISIAANIGTFISSILVFFTLQEMKAQRKAQVKPELVLESNEFSIVNHSYCKLINDVIDETLNTFDIRICNEGLSLAKNVNLKFSYSIKDFRKIFIQENFSIKQKQNMVDISSPLICKNIEMKFDNYKSISLIKNEINACKENKVSVPEGYKTLLIIFEYFCNKANDYFIPIMPKLFCTVVYEDILNNKYKEKYSIQIYFYGIGNQSNNSNPKYNIIIEKYRFNIIPKISGIFQKSDL